MTVFRSRPVSRTLLWVKVLYRKSSLKGYTMAVFTGAVLTPDRYDLFATAWARSAALARRSL